MRTSQSKASSPIAAIGILISALAIATLAQTRPPEVPPARLADGPAAPACVDINRASALELERLPRVGPSLAARIIADREANGEFDDAEALDRVRGIGPATLRLIRPHLCEQEVSTAHGALPDPGQPR